MVLTTETFNQSVHTDYSEAVNTRYTFQPLWVSDIIHDELCGCAFEVDATVASSWQIDLESIYAKINNIEKTIKRCVINSFYFSNAAYKLLEHTRGTQQFRSSSVR